MVSTLSVLAASLMLGQTSNTPVPSSAQPAPKVYIYRDGVLTPVDDAQKPPTWWRNPNENNHPILTKIQGWFKRNSDNTMPPPPEISGIAPPARFIAAPVTPPTPVPAPAVAPGAPPEFPKKMPAAQTFTPKNEVVVVQPKEGSGAAKTDVISSVSLKAAPTAKTPILPANVERIGRDDSFAWLTGQIEMEKGLYVLYYATPETVDPYHGRLILSPQKVDMRQYHNGDLISVRGQVSAGRYLVTSASLIERPKTASH